jgi:Tetratricopeptide repeat
VDKHGFYDSFADLLGNKMTMGSIDGSHLDFMFDLATALLLHFQRTSLISDIEEVMLIFHDLLFLHLTSYPNRPSLLNNLGLGLQNRFRRTGSMADLEEAISMHRESLSLCPSSHPHHSLSLINIASALGYHFRETGSMTDLDEAIHPFSCT